MHTGLKNVGQWITYDDITLVWPTMSRHIPGGGGVGGGGVGGGSSSKPGSSSASGAGGAGVGGVPGTSSNSN